MTGWSWPLQLRIREHLDHLVQDLPRRVTYAERDVVTEELASHFQVGRLTQHEFDDRMSMALKAKTRDDLDHLLQDLPGSAS